TGPGVQHATGDDIDHAAHRVGAIQRRHRAADHLDALDRVQRRDVVELVAAEVVRVDVAVVVLATAVDQDQGVVRAHAAHRDRALPGLVAGLADVHAFQVAHAVEQGHVGPLRQVLARDHGDAGGRVGDLLLETGGGDHDGVEVDRPGGRSRGGGGLGGKAEGERAGQGRAAQQAAQGGGGHDVVVQGGVERPG